MKEVRTHKRLFSLLELFIVIFIIGLVAGSIGLSFPKLINKERYEGSIEAIISKIEWVEEILFTYNSDVDLHLQMTPKGLICTIVPSTPVPDRILNALNSSKPLKEISRFTFEGKEYKELSLHFYSSCSRCPRGILSFISSTQEQTYLSLKGFPTKIEVSKTPPKLPALKAAYPNEILSEGVYEN